MLDGMHDWVLANENMAKVLAAKGYHYQFVFARNAGHCDGSVKQQTLPAALRMAVEGLPHRRGEITRSRIGPAAATDPSTVRRVTSGDVTGASARRPA